MDALSIYEHIRKGMTQTLPLFGTLPGNENGASFVLFRKPTEPPIMAVQPPVPEKTNAALIVVTQPPASEKINAASAVTLHVKAGSAFKAWAVPADNPNAPPTTVSDGSQLPIGDWVIEAQLPDDIQSSWSKKLLLPEAVDTTLTIPALSHSVAWQGNALDHQRSLLVPVVEQEEAAYKVQKTWGWVSLAAWVAGVGIAGYGWIDGKAAYTSYTSAIGSAVESSRNRLDLDTTLLWSGVGVGGVGISVSSLLFLLDPSSANRTKP